MPLASPPILSGGQKPRKRIDRERIALLLTYATVISVPVILLPVLFYQDLATAFIHCAIATAILYATRVIPVQVTAMLPLMFLSSNTFQPDSVSPLYLSLPVLQTVAAMIMVTGIESTSLYPRCAHRLLRRVGTRARPLIFSMASLSFVIPFCLNSLAAMLIMFALCKSAVGVLKLEDIQRLHRRILFDSTTQNMPPRLRKTLQDYVLCEECQLPDMLCEMPCDDMPYEMSGEMPCDIPPEMPCDSPETPSEGLNDNPSAAPIAVNVGAQQSAAPDPLPVDASRDVLSVVSFDVPESQPMRDKRDSAATVMTAMAKIFEDETRKSSVADEKPEKRKRRKSIARGVSFDDDELSVSRKSPAASPTRRPPTQHCPEFLEQFAMDNDVLMTIITWHVSRYLTIEGHIMYGIMLLNVIASMLNISGSPHNFYFRDYASRTFHKSHISQVNWTLLVLPVALSAMIAAVRRLDRQFLAYFDAKQSPDMVAAIRDIIVEDEELFLGKIRKTEVGPLVCFVVWLIRMSGLLGVSSPGGVPKFLLAVDYCLVVMLFLLPASVNEVKEETASRVISKLPWGAIFLVGGISVTEAAWTRVTQSGSMEEYARKQFGGAGPLMAQLLLVCTSSVMTEFIGGVSTVAFLLPIATDLASDIPCHPMYLEIPLTLAASTTLILPTSSVAVAILYDAASIGATETVVSGLIIKAATALAILLGANTYGPYLFSWDNSTGWDSTSTGPHFDGTAHVL